MTLTSGLGFRAVVHTLDKQCSSACEHCLIILPASVDRASAISAPAAWFPTRIRVHHSHSSSFQSSAQPNCRINVAVTQLDHPVLETVTETRTNSIVAIPRSKLFTSILKLRRTCRKSREAVWVNTKAREIMC